jgi:hypothetical protein
MSAYRLRLLFLCSFLFCGVAFGGQTKKPAKVTAVPGQVRFSGAAKTSAGDPRQGVVGMLFAIYGEQTGGAPLWQEAQNVQLDVQGRYNVLLGATKNLPAEIFASNDARWLGIQVLADAEPEQARVMLVSVPYALKAQDAETLGGRPASDYMLAAAAFSPDKTGVRSTTSAPGVNPEGQVQTSTTTTLNGIAKFSGTDLLADSMMVELYNQSATDAFGNVLANEDVLRLGDGTGLKKRLEINGRMLADGFDVITSAPNSVHVVNNYLHGVGFQGNANGIGFSTGFAGTSRGLNGAGIRAFALPPLSLQPQAPGDFTWGIQAANYHPQGAGLGVLSAYDGTALGSDFPALTEAIGIYAAAAGTTGIAAVLDQRAAGGGKIFSARALGVEKISMTSAGNVTASGTITANAFSGDGSGLSNVTGVGSLASDPAACAANNFVTDIAANGTLTCAQPASSNLSDGASLATKTYADAGDASLAAPQYVTLGVNATLANERVLTAGNGISLTDGGAGSTVRLDSKAEFAQTTIQAGDTLTNWAIGDSFATTYTIPANTLTAGTVIEVWASGTTTSSTVGQNFGFGMKFGSTIAFNGLNGPYVNPLSFGLPWQLSARIVCTSASGTSASLEAIGVLTVKASNADFLTHLSANSLPVNIDPTVDQELKIYQSVVANDPGDQVVLRQFIVKILK